jgi:glutamine---fructose-6-phosphate transaminase (isomerizing)
MCGIFGHVGSPTSYDKIIRGLKFLEYRGYDSAGIAGIDSGNLFCYKEKGKISELEKTLERKLHAFQSSIGHTRWATHGRASKQNAHPHLDQKKQIAVVHNGIIENHRELREMLLEKGYRFVTDTDSEVIAQLIAFFYEGNLALAVRRATEKMRGFWGLAVIHKKHPGQIVATRCENPIVLGYSAKNQETFVSSDPYAFEDKDLELYYLKNHEIALLSKEKVEIYDADSQLIECQWIKNHLPDQTITKGDFEHFMLKEIFEQPIVLRNCLQGRLASDRSEVHFEEFPLTKETFEHYEQILLLGCGTSWHASCIAAQQMEELTGLICRSEIASEFLYKRLNINAKTLVIALSQSGETFETVSAMRRAKSLGSTTLAICNVVGSTLMREADHTLSLRAGPEVSVCSTKAFTCQLAVLALLAIKMGSFSSNQGQKWLDEIVRLPQIIETVLEQEPWIAEIARKYARRSNFFFLGRQYMVPTAFEAALKLKEISYLSASAHPGGELKHGPLALIDEKSVVIGLCGNSQTDEKLISNLTEVHARKGAIIALSPQDLKGLDGIVKEVIHLPHICDPLAPIPYSVATQLLAYHVAKTLKREIDQPRNLAKSVTVE